MTEHPSKEKLPPASTKREIGTATAKGALAAIPFVGGAAAEFVGLYLSTPVAHRRDAWLQDLAIRLGELEGQISGFSLDTLADNEQFVSATLQATQAALRTHQKEKLDALRNAVLNSAAKHEPQDDYQTVFLSLIDRFSPAHLRLLKSCRNVPFGYSPDYIRWVLEKTEHPETNRWRELPRWVRNHSPGFGDTSQEFIQVLLSDLHSAGLTIGEDNSMDLLPPGQKWTTEFGDRFLKFIESPLKAE